MSKLKYCVYYPPFLPKVYQLLLGTAILNGNWKHDDRHFSAMKDEILVLQILFWLPQLHVRSKKILNVPDESTIPNSEIWDMKNNNIKVLATMHTVKNDRSDITKA